MIPIINANQSVKFISLFTISHESADQRLPLFHFRRIRGKTVESAHNQRRAHFVSGIPSSLLADLLYMRQRALALLQRRQKFGIGALAFDRQITLWCLVKKLPVFSQSKHQSERRRKRHQYPKLTSMQCGLRAEY